MMDKPEIRTVVVERDIAHPPEKIWRALTQPHLISEWLFKSDFRPEIGAGFKFTQDWGDIDCRVLEVEPHRSLAYTWAAFGLESTVTWTLTPIGTGTRLRMEQAGFTRDQDAAYKGSRASWPHFFTALEKLLAELE